MEMINILGKTYVVCDTIEKITIPDCFVIAKNKTGTAHGEAKLYIGNEGDKLRSFYGKRSFALSCFVLKKDLLSFLKDCKDEYERPEQNYKAKPELPRLWKERKAAIESLPMDKLDFSIMEQDQIGGPRVYIKSDDEAYKCIRTIALPEISYLSIIKLIDPTTKSPVYYFRPFVDYFGSPYHPAKVAEAEEKARKNRSAGVCGRTGQSKYREELLAECPFCPMTGVSDDRLLIASHIKPFIDSDDREKYDPKNGIMFTPTYDFLFDRGYISFTDKKHLLVSPWLSKMTCKYLSLASQKVISNLPVEGRTIYLEYHRTNIFKS